MEVESRRRLISSIITVGLLASPLHYKAAETPAVPAQADIKSTQQTAEEKLPDSCSSTLQKLTLKFKPVLTTAAGIAALAGAIYLHDRSTVLVHEGSHVMAAELAGYPTELYISPQFRGGGTFSFYGCPHSYAQCFDLPCWSYRWNCS